MKAPLASIAGIARIEAHGDVFIWENFCFALWSWRAARVTIGKRKTPAARAEPFDPWQGARRSAFPEVEKSDLRGMIPAAKDIFGYGCFRLTVRNLIWRLRLCSRGNTRKISNYQRQAIDER